MSKVIVLTACLIASIPQWPMAASTRPVNSARARRASNPAGLQAGQAYMNDFFRPVTLTLPRGWRPMAGWQGWALLRNGRRMPLISSAYTAADVQRAHIFSAEGTLTSGRQWSPATAGLEVWSAHDWNGTLDQLVTFVQRQVVGGRRSGAALAGTPNAGTISLAGRRVSYIDHVAQRGYTRVWFRIYFITVPAYVYQFTVSMESPALLSSADALVRQMVALR